MTRATKAALAEKAAAAMPKQPTPPPFVKWICTPRAVSRGAMPACLVPFGRCPDGWAVEGSPEEAAMKAAAMAEFAAQTAPATEDWRAVSTLPAKPVGPHTEDERKASLANPEFGTLEYLETVKWPADARGEEAESWEAWRARQPWAAEADALAAAKDAAPEPEAPRAPPPVRRPPPVAPKAAANPSPPSTGRRPPPIPPRRASV